MLLGLVTHSILKNFSSTTPRIWGQDQISNFEISGILRDLFLQNGSLDFGGGYVVFLIDHA